MSRREVFFYPEAPSPSAVIAKICPSAGYDIVADPSGPCDLAIAWDTNTFRGLEPALRRLSESVDVWNLRCVDVSKQRVDAAFRDAFGRASLVDPRTYRGFCVAKSNLNAAHDGVVVEAPLAVAEAARVYQRLVRNDVGDGTIEDIRTPVFGGRIPFVYLKYRPVASRFDQFETRVAIEETAVVFTALERSQIAAFARAIGMDYGELDVLRDRGDGCLYVVDANPTPFGPPGLLSPREQRLAIDRLAGAFEALLQGGAHARSASRLGGRVSSLSRADEPPIVVDAQPGPAVSVVVVTRNEGERVRETVAQLCATLPPPNEILVVDDGSDDGSTGGLGEGDPRVQIIRASGLGVARGRNLGAARSSGRVIVFADAHLGVPQGWWEPLVAAVEDPRVGGAAPAIANSEREWERGYGLRFTGFDLDVEWLPRLGDEPYAVPLMPWCFGAMRRDVFEATGGFDAGMIQWGSIDNEMSVRLWALGFELKIVPGVEVAHLFRDARPYPIQWTPVVHNRLRLALVHFELGQIARVVEALGHHPEFADAVARAATGDVPARRSEMASRRTRDSSWLLQDIEITS